MAVEQAGDVAARVAVRFDEALESLRLDRARSSTRCSIRRPPGTFRTTPGDVPADRLASATSKAGAVRCSSRSKAAPDGTIRRCHPHDPSWSNWPVLEHAVIGNIVPDFPLINKSFNLSYSGHDL